MNDDVVRYVPPPFNVRSLTPQFKIGVRAENPRLSPHHQGLAPLFNQFFGSLGTSDPVQPPVCQISASEKSQSLTFWESLEAHNSSRPPPICETPPPQSQNCFCVHQFRRGKPQDPRVSGLDPRGAMLCSELILRQAVIQLSLKHLQEGARSQGSPFCFQIVLIESIS